MRANRGWLPTVAPDEGTGRETGNTSARNRSPVRVCGSFHVRPLPRLAAADGCCLGRRSRDDLSQGGSRDFPSRLASPNPARGLASGAIAMLQYSPSPTPTTSDAIDVSRCAQT